MKKPKKQAKSREYFDPCYLRVGEFSIWQPNQFPGKYAIYHESGEGGIFDGEKFEAVIRRFYEDNF